MNFTNLYENAVADPEEADRQGVFDASVENDNDDDKDTDDDGDDDSIDLGDSDVVGEDMHANLTKKFTGLTILTLLILNSLLNSVFSKFKTLFDRSKLNPPLAKIPISFL